jgi:hypothetical protein
MADVRAFLREHGSRLASVAFLRVPLDYFYRKTSPMGSNFGIFSGKPGHGPAFEGLNVFAYVPGPQVKQ